MILTMGICIGGGIWYRTQLAEYGTILGSYCIYPFMYAHKTMIRPCMLWYDARLQYESLRHAYQTLQNNYAQLQGQYIALQSLCAYTADIERELSWFKKRFESREAYIVPVMGVHQTDRQHTMLIEGGEQRGIKRDMVVLADNVLVGKVVTVYPWYAVVQLITDPASCVAISGVSSGAHGIVRGTGDTQILALERVDHLSPVQEKELLLSSGDGIIVPRGYGIGTVDTYNSDGLYYTGRVKTLIDAAHLKTCVVLDRGQLSKIS